MDFTSLLNTNASAIERPPILPKGTYVWRVSKNFKESEMKGGEFKVIDLPITAVQPYDVADDCDPDELEAFGALSQAQHQIRFMFPTAADKQAEVQRTLYSLKRFLLDVLKIEADESATLKELLALAPGHEFHAQASKRTSGEDEYLDVKNYGPLE